MLSIFCTTITIVFCIIHVNSNLNLNNRISSLSCELDFEIESTKSNQSNNYYNVFPINYNNIGMGAHISGIDLCLSSESEVINLIKSDVIKYEFIIIRNQCHFNNNFISPLLFSNIVRKFGVDVQLGYSHVFAPPFNTNITVFSNNNSYGHTTLGKKWHIDGWSHVPYSFVFNHMISFAEYGGGTELISNKYLLSLISIKNNNLYNILNSIYMVNAKMFLHPIIGINPKTNNEYLVVHTPKHIREFIGINNKSLISTIDVLSGKYINIQKYIHQNQYLFDTKQLKLYTKNEINNIYNNILNFIKNESLINNKLIYLMKYEPGDIIIRDNVAVLHRAEPQSNVIGIRVLWALFLKGKYKASKFKRPQI